MRSTKQRQGLQKTSKSSNQPFLWIIMLIGIAVIRKYVNDPTAHTDFQGFIDPKSEGRVKRDANDNLKELLDRTSAIGRISNGISLQTGLINGSISIDDAIGELSNFGPVKVSDVIGFKSDAVNKFATKMSEISSTIDSSQGTIDSEKQALEFDRIRKESESIGNLEISAELGGYFGKVKDFQTGFEFTLLDEITAVFDSLSGELNKILQLSETISPNEKSTLALGWSLFMALDEKFQGLGQQLWPKVRSLHDKLKPFEVLESGTSHLKPFKRMVDLMNLRSNYPSPFSDKLEKNIAELLNILTSLKKSQKDLNLIDNLMKSRANPHGNIRQFTNGFPNGFADLERLLKDVRDPLVEKISNSSEGQKKLYDGLKPLLTAQYKIGKLDKKFESFSSDASTSTQQIRQLQSELSKISINEQNVKNGLNVYKNSVPPVTSSTARDNVELMLQKSSELSALISAIKTSLVEDELKTAVASFTKQLNFTDVTDASTTNEVFAVTKHLKDTGALEAFQTVINTIKSKLSGYNATFVQSIATSIVQDPIDKFKIAKEVTDESELQKKLRDLGDDAKQVTLSIEAVQKLRGLQQSTKSLKVLKDLASTIADASKDLKNLKSISEELKKSSNLPETRDLSEFKNSKDIEKAVLGLYKIDDFRNQKDLINKLKSIDGSVKSVINKLSDPTKKDEIQKKWDGFDKDMDALNSGLKKIDEVASGLDMSKVKTLQEYGIALSKLQKIGDVNFDGKLKSEALDALIPLVKDPVDQNILTEAKNTLDGLENLDLKFSNYHKSFTNAPSAFQSLHGFLSQFLNPVVAPLQLIQTSTSDGKAGGAGKKDEKSNTWVIVGICVGAVGVVGGSVTCYIYRDKLREKIKNMKNINTKKPSGNSLTRSPSTQEGETPATATTSTSTEGKLENPVNLENGEGKADVNENKKEVKATKVDEVDGVAKPPPKPVVVAKEKEKKSKDTKNKDTKSKKSKSKDTKSKEKSNKKEPKSQEPTDRDLSRSTRTDQTITAEHGSTERNLKEEIEVKPVECVQWASDQCKCKPIQMTIQAEALQKGVYSKLVPKMKLTTMALQYLPERKHRDLRLAPCNPDFAPKVSANGQMIPFHWTRFSGRGKLQCFITQDPMVKDENHDDTREDFCHALMEQEADAIVMVTPFEENGQKRGQYMSPNAGEFVNCGQYKVTTETRQEGLVNVVGETVGTLEMTTRTIKIEDTSKKPVVSRIFAHYQYHVWPVNSIPTYNHKTLNDLWNVLLKLENPIFIHSALGTGRAMCFVGMEMGARKVEEDPLLSLDSLVKWIRKFRWNSIMTLRQTIWLQLGIVFRILSIYGMKEDDKDDKSSEYKGDMKMYGVQFQMLYEISFTKVTRTPWEEKHRPNGPKMYLKPQEQNENAPRTEEDKRDTYELLF